MSFFIDVSIFLCSIELKNALDDNKIKKPVITSECPGWVCYLEKVLSEGFLDYSSKVKTPQQIAALLLKKFFFKIRNSLEYKEVFVGSIQPCFDKKLEPMRPENHIEENKTIDIVLTTSEIKELIEENRKEVDEIPIDNQYYFLHNFQQAYDFYISNKNDFQESMLLAQTIDSLDLSVNSMVNSTSNNYLYSVLSIIDSRNISFKETDMVYEEKKNENH